MKITNSYNKLIFVGFNGLVKTTVVSILYFLLTEQWSRLFEYEFSSLLIAINQEEITINFGYMDPIDEISGVQRRLQNLGFYEILQNQISNLKHCFAIEYNAIQQGCRFNGIYPF